MLNPSHTKPPLVFDANYRISQLFSRKSFNNTFSGFVFFVQSVVHDCNSIQLLRVRRSIDNVFVCCLIFSWKTMMWAINFQNHHRNMHLFTHFPFLSMHLSACQLTWPPKCADKLWFLLWRPPNVRFEAGNTKKRYFLLKICDIFKIFDCHILFLSVQAAPNLVVIHSDCATLTGSFSALRVFLKSSDSAN